MLAERIKSTWKYSTLLMGALALALFFLAYPIFVIRPFRHQGARELAFALQVIQARPVVEALCVAAALFAFVMYWRAHHGQQARLGRIACGAGALLVCVFAGFSRVNVYEIMFHPTGQPAFEGAGMSKLDSAEMVIAVKVGGEARAYPIRAISYHHIVNDVVGGVPIVATY